jgi:hypothetical protein
MSETMTEDAKPISDIRPPRRARSMLWRLVLLIPALVCAACGFAAYKNVPEGGTVTSISLKTRGDLSGQTRNAYDSVDPGTPDIYLKLQLRDESSFQLPAYKDTAIGSGLTWTLPTPRDLAQITMVEVWDDNTLLSNKQLDRVAINNTWAGEGQTFAITLTGTHPAPPPWALPLLVAGATLGGIVLLKFVWDQAI